MTKNKRWLQVFLVSVTLLLVGLIIIPAPMSATIPDEEDKNRARLLAYVLKRQVENHFSRKEIDDELSAAAYHLYIKQLDSQKRLLLAAEVEQLEIFKDRIDDEVKSGRIILAPMSLNLLANGVARAEKLVEKALEQPFSFDVIENYETDPDKLTFCETEVDLAERWRLDLKYRTLTRYLNLLEDAGSRGPSQGVCRTTQGHGNRGAGKGAQTVS